VRKITYTWSQSGVITGASNTSDGVINTVITSTLSGNYAAKTCADLVANTFSDWKLPSKEELNLMYQNRILLITTSGIYWSSKEEE